MAFMGGIYGDLNSDWVRRIGLAYLVWDAASAPHVADLSRLPGHGVHRGPTLSQGASLSVAKVVYDRPEALGDDEWTLALTEGAPATRSAVVNRGGWTVVGGSIVKIPGAMSSFQISVSTKAGIAYDVWFRATGTRGTIFPVVGGAAGVVIPTTGADVYTARMTPVARGDLLIIATGDFDGSLTDIAMTEETAHQFHPLPVAFDDGIQRVEAEPAGTEICRVKTDFAKRVDADVTVGAPSRPVYLLWPMPYTVPCLDGVAVPLIQDGGQPAYLELPAGRLRFRDQVHQHLERRFHDHNPRVSGAPGRLARRRGLGTLAPARRNGSGPRPRAPPDLNPAPAVNGIIQRWQKKQPLEARAPEVDPRAAGPPA